MKNKYTTSNYFSQGNGNQVALNNYLQDIAYSSEALKKISYKKSKNAQTHISRFFGEITYQVFMMKNIQALNEGAALHQTEFLMYDTANQLTEKSASSNY